MSRSRATGVLLLTLLAVALVVPATLSADDSGSSGRSYRFYVCSESEDEVALLRFGPGGLEVLKTISVGSFPAEIEGPHGITVAPDGRYWYVTLAHGAPFGSLHKYRTGSDEWMGEVTIGMFPATLAISRSTDFLYVVNFDLHGERKPSSVSVIEPESLVEIARIETGVMPHGSRMNAAGDRHYSVSMGQDQLIEVDALRFEVTRRLTLTALRSGERGGAQHLERSIAPTWVTSPTSAGKVYVTGSAVDAIFEVDIDDWRQERVFGAGGSGPYNAEVAEAVGLLVVTYKGSSEVGFWDLESGREVARAATSRSLPHGVVVTTDGLYSIVTVEGVGSEPGTVEVFDNRSYARVAAVDVGKQAGGISLWDESLLPNE